MDEGYWVAREALRFEEERPTRPESLEGIVQTRDGGEQLGGAAACQIGTAESDRLLEDGVFLENDAGSDQAGPRQIVGQSRRGFSVFTERKHRASFRGRGGVDRSPGQHVEEMGIAARQRGEDAVKDRAHRQHPELMEAEDKCRHGRPEQEREVARQTGHHDRLGQRAMEGHLQAVVGRHRDLPFRPTARR